MAQAAVPSRARRRGLAVGALVAALVGQALAGTAVAAPSGTASSSGRGLAWKACPEEKSVQCAKVKVPVDWKNPKGKTIQIAVARHRATDPKRRIGSLLVNPGGPGGSGVDFAMMADGSFSPEVLARFDIVGFDPRGVARSAPVRCDESLIVAQDKLLFPKNDAQFSALRKATRKLGDNCKKLNGPLVENVDTASVVRDMDAIRAALGESRISYYGVSYGTLIGQQYAQMFPKRVRAMTLDSNMDHSLFTWGYQTTQAEAVEGSFNQFADWCKRTSGCALHGKDVRALFDSLMKRAEAGKLTVPGEPSEKITVRDLQEAIFGYFYDPASWFELAEVLKEVDAGNTRAVPARERGEAVEFAYRAVMCEDFNFTLKDHKELAKLEGKLKRLAPHTRLSPLGWTDLTGCDTWPRKVSNPQAKLKVDGTPKILMTNSKWDPATPYSWGQNSAKQIGKEAVLLTYDGVGHGDYWLSPCARKAIDTYLVSLKTPKSGTHCPAVWPKRQDARAQGDAGTALVNPLPALLGTGTTR
ncbi:alpha/beta hydrolase [Streptomyces capparidis]